MNPFDRVLAGSFAVFMACGLVRAFRSGIIGHEDGPLDLNEHPLAFSMLVAVNLCCVAMLAWLAAGQEVTTLWRLAAPTVGLKP
ncbi:hypothetical protein [uncultured Bradyrhizobium sp.]|uniref:hypothetical protein n=1 Tax=uncultured Bradyrhizobium sp. TaxID=199684 RepID=UPI0035C9F606